MIPAKLKLENFMCFSNIEVDFTGLKTACLTGKVGAGKSSLLDAITWVFWEKARSSSEQLIKLGRNNMRVELEFVMDDIRYKILRYYRKGALNNPRKGMRKVLEFFYYDDKNKTWQPYSGKNLKETEDKIASVIKIDYEAFINSVYLKQGNTDDFISKSPEERKRILAEILGLGEYERLYRLSNQKAEELKVDAKVLKEQINDGEIKQFSLKKLKDEKELLISQINIIQEELALIIKEKKELEAKTSEYNVLRERKSLYFSIKNKYQDDIELTAKYIENVRQSVDNFNQKIKLESVIKQQYENYLKLKQKAKDLDSKEQDYHSLKDRLIEFGSKQIIDRYGAEHEYNKISEELDQKLKDLDYYRGIIVKSEEINKKYIEYKDLVEKVENLDKFQLESSNIELKIAKLENVINGITQKFKTELEQLNIRIDEINNKIEIKDQIIENIKFLEDELKHYDKYDAELERIREKGISQREIVLDRTNKNAFLEIDLDKLKNRIENLQSNNHIRSCPTCDGKILNPEDIVRKFEFEIDNLMIQLEANDNDISIAEDEIKFYRIAYKEKKKYLSKRSSIIFNLAELKTELKNIEIEEEKLNVLVEQRDILKQKLATQYYAADERYQIKVLEERKEQLKDLLNDYDNMKVRIHELSHINKAYKELQESKIKASEIEEGLPYFTKSKRKLEKILEEPVRDSQSDFASDAYARLLELDYDLNEHIKLRQEIAGSQAVEYEYLELQFAYQKLPFAQKNLEHLQKNINIYFEEIDKINNDITKVGQQLEESKDYSSRLAEINEGYMKANMSLNTCNCDLAVINERIRILDDVLQDVKNKRKNLDLINKDIAEYLELANALSKKGLQDVIIENSLPDIELEANRYLSKLSDSQMRISLKSSKSNKTHSYNDRLDIYIADKFGTRNYELYSGGEVFKINFAIRLALSKLLAKSRGVKLQALIIDDIFGSQDQIGKDMLLETIKSIQGEFDMILLVTHIDEFIDLFPCRIEISKESGDSTVQVVA